MWRLHPNHCRMRHACHIEALADRAQHIIVDELEGAHRHGGKIQRPNIVLPSHDFLQGRTIAKNKQIPTGHDLLDACDGTPAFRGIARVGEIRETDAVFLTKAARTASPRRLNCRPSE